VSGPIIERVAVSVYRIPTSTPESDGTFAWNSTTLVLVEIVAAGQYGLGYTYADTATALLVHDLLGPAIEGRDVRHAPALVAELKLKVRNLGRTGITAMAISAIDVALWDLRAKLLGVPLVALLGAARSEVALYGSGGFTSYTIEMLQEQLAGWVEDGIQRVKMKVGRDPKADLDRVVAAREAVGNAELFVDANGAYSRKQAIALAHPYSQLGVTWFEEPVDHEDLEGLRQVRERSPDGTEVAAGEYAYGSRFFRRLLEAGAVDVLQADATRCGGYTGFLAADSLCEAWMLPLSSHCAPSLHLPVACAAGQVRHMEYFHDHVRIENLLFDGVNRPVNGKLAPDLSRPGLGLELKRSDAQRYAA